MNDSDEMSFEESYERLEEIVEELDSDLMREGDIGLDDALELYEEGVKLVRVCRERLEDAEQKLEVIDVDDESEETR